MTINYQIKTPADFNKIIGDILTWFNESQQTNLVLALQGDLGAGKTTFTQELSKQLGVEEVVNSPTFTIMKQYDVTSPQFDSLIHIDAYRLETETETKPLYFTELFQQPKSIICIEWPEIIANVLPSNAIWLKFEIKEAEIRQVTVELK